MLQEVEAESSAHQRTRMERFRPWMLAVVLFFLDGLYLLGNVVHLTSNDPGEPTSPFSAVQWDGNNDGSYIEIFGHTQLLAGAVMLLFLVVTRRSLTFAVWTVLLLVLVIDDFLLVHESGGAMLVNSFALPAVAGLRPQDLGELIVWAAMAGVLGCALLIAYVVGSESERRDTRTLFGWLCLLIVFAVGVDLLRIAVEPHLGYLGNLVVTLVETTGELVAMTLIVLAVHRIVERPLQVSS